MQPAPLVSLLLLALAALAPSPVRADGRASQAEEINRPDVVAQAMTVEPRWHLGLLRLEVVLAQGSSAASSWEIVLTGDSGQTVTVTAADAQSRILATTERTKFYLDVPVPQWKSLRVATTPPALSVVAVEVRYPSHARAQQRLDGSHVDYFDQDVSTPEKAIALAFGRLDVTGIDLDPNARICTAFRVKKGLWLTAAHCVTRDSKASDAASAWIQPANYADKVEPTSRLAARVVATGQKDGEWRPGEELRNDELDFALLAVADDPGGPTFSMVSPPAPGTANLQLLMHWSGSPAGKARSAGAGCKIQHLSGTNSKTKPDQCYRTIRHGCTSDDGASGAALVLLGSPQSLVGLNYRGGLPAEFNCAVPAFSIHKFLCQTKPQLASELSPCPPS